MRNFTYFLAMTGLLVGLTGCSSDSSAKLEQTHVVAAGEKAPAGHLTYSVLDSQILPQITEAGDTPRVPKERFIVVQIAVSNSGNTDANIPGVTLEADSGTTYNELTDGNGVQGFLGVLRHAGPLQTIRGAIVFDAPAAHYRLRFADENDENEILADLPLTYAHEKINSADVPAAVLPDLTAPSGPTAPGAPPAK
jgi:hypothetical protein